MFYKPYLCRVRIISYGSCLVSYLTFKKKKRYKSTSTTSPNQQERSGPTPNSVSKKALGTKQFSNHFDSQGLSAKQRHLYLAASKIHRGKSQGTGSFLMDHWNMINPPNFIFQPSIFEGYASFQGR